MKKVHDHLILFYTKIRLNKKKYSIIIFIIALCVFFVWLLIPPKILQSSSYSTLFYDYQGKLLRATLADDEQLRFEPDTTSLPQKYITAAITFEDKRYFSHLGVDPLAFMKAIFTNLKAGKRIRGGSTIPMQVARLVHPKKRTYFNKLIEILVAFKLSIHNSKAKVLKMYASQVPMGGNIVGIHAAAYRYFGKPVSEITWAEAALFAVLPNSPSMINLSKNLTCLKKKRNHLLLTLYNSGKIDKMSYELACLEPLPESSRNLPFFAPHFTQFVQNSNKANRRTTSLDLSIQRKVEQVIKHYYLNLFDEGIVNLAVLVAETESGKVRSYVGSQNFLDSLNGGQVDGIQASRSTGSLLKPFLVARCLDRGPYTMQSKIQDVPTYFGTFAPQNASKEFSGLVSLESLLIQSLNVPAVRLLNAYGVRDFYDFMIESNFSGLFRSPDGYGLSLILGGAEASLWELVQLYMSLGNLGKFRKLNVDIRNDETENSYRICSEGAAWLVLNALTKLSRPGSEFYWQQFNNQIPVAWKTGTSYGQKDGWAIGVNKQWTIGVWAGNFTGEGNAALSGAKSAAPLLFNLFNLMTDQQKPMWYEEPESDLVEIDCCKDSGYPANPYCTHIEKIKRPVKSYRPGTCPYHKKFILDRKTGHSVCSLCWDNVDTVWAIRYIVPPSVKDIYKKIGVAADDVPFHAANCPTHNDFNRFELIYPINGVKIFVPRDYDGNYEKVVFSAKHQLSSCHLFWYLNNELIGETVEIHQLPIELKPGNYKLVVQDEEGFKRSVVFNAYKN